MMSERMSRKTHVLKCWPPYFDSVKSGLKTFEVRKDDRGFRQNDELLLKEFLPSTGMYSGAECLAMIDGVWEGLPGVEPGYVVMAIHTIAGVPF
jgi:hypothetical protein